MKPNEERALYTACRDAAGTEREAAAYAELRAALHVNEPPPGWSVEEDIREELLAEKASAPRAPAPKTWSQLERLAAEQDLRLIRSIGCVTVETLRCVPFVTITTDQIDRDDDADRVVRAALGAALDALRRML